MINIVTLDNDRSKTCCFTGHRPEKLFPGASLQSVPVRRLLSIIALHINTALEMGCDTFISGMARGIDIWAANLVIDMRRRHPDIKLICAVPFPGYADPFLGIDKWHYNTIIEQADKTLYTAEHYSRGSMSIRNRFMVDNSSRLIGVVDDMQSGTGQTIRYARRQGVDCDIIWLKDAAPMLFAGSDELLRR